MERVSDVRGSYEAIKADIEKIKDILRADDNTTDEEIAERLGYDYEYFDAGSMAFFKDTVSEAKYDLEDERVSNSKQIRDSKSYPTFRIEVTDVNTPSNPVLVFIANDFTEEEAEDFLAENYNQVRWIPDNPYGYNAAKVWWGKCEGGNISFMAALQNDY